MGRISLLSLGLLRLPSPHEVGRGSGRGVLLFRDYGLCAVFRTFFKRFLFLLLICPALAQPDTNALDTNMLARLTALVALKSKLHFQHGTVSLPNGVAALTLPEPFCYLSPQDADIVIVKIWGNPPGQKTLGMIVPDESTFLSRSAWAVIITYLDEGYVKDSDADKIDYAKMMKQMQDAVKSVNPERQKAGYPAIDLVGWAAPPSYDKATHKMYWAKNLRFSGEDANTLNYDIRVLGRHGVLVLNAVATMDQLAEIQAEAPAIVKMADFTKGNRYTDFDGSKDKVAAYGLAALVLGGIAAKAGFFKILLVGLLAAKKFIIIGLIAASGFIKKLFNRKTPPPPSPPPAAIT